MVNARSDILRNAMTHAILWFTTLVMLYPILVVILSAFKSTAEIYSSPFSLPATFNLTNVETLEVNGLGGNDFLTIASTAGTALTSIVFNGGDGDDTLNAANATVSSKRNCGPAHADNPVNTAIETTRPSGSIRRPNRHTAVAMMINGRM